MHDARHFVNWFCVCVWFRIRSTFLESVVLKKKASEWENRNAKIRSHSHARTHTQTHTGRNSLVFFLNPIFLTKKRVGTQIARVQTAAIRKGKEWKKKWIEMKWPKMETNAWTLLTFSVVTFCDVALFFGPSLCHCYCYCYYYLLPYY